jgi:CxxC motif-containing protein (DUF1111 family)
MAVSFRIARSGLQRRRQAQIGHTEEKVKLADGGTVSLRAALRADQRLGYGPISPDVMISPRVAPPMIGLGLLEAVPEEQILALAQSEAAKNDGISGSQTGLVSASTTVMLGRFGWQASHHRPTGEGESISIVDDVPRARAIAPRSSLTASTRRAALAELSECRSGRGLFNLVTLYSLNSRCPRGAKPDARRC